MALSYRFFLMLRPFAILSILAPKRAVAATAYLSRGLFLSLTYLILKAILLNALSSGKEKANSTCHCRSFDCLRDHGNRSQLLQDRRRSTTQGRQRVPRLAVDHP